MKNMILVLAIALMVLGAGCIQTGSSSGNTDVTTKTTGNSMMESNTSMAKQPDSMETSADSMMETNTSNSMMKEEKDSMMVSSSVAYVPFTQTAYDEARSNGKVIFLEFYANWCPECKEQAPVLEQAFATLENENVVAFRVNYNDDQTDDSERLLARQFNIVSQHTHIILDSNGAVAKRAQGFWSLEQIHAEIEKVAG